MIFRLMKPFYIVYALLIFLLIMLIISPFVVISSFFGKIKGGNLIYQLCMFWGDAWFFLIGIRHRNMYEAAHDRTRPYIFVANHISYLDAPTIVKTIRQPVRVLGKIEMTRIPIFGYIYKNAIVTVDRSSAAHRSRSVRVLKSVLKKQVSIFIFPEGTFNLTHKPLKEFYDGAFRIAIETQTPIKPVLFLDAYNRMHYKSIWSLEPGISRSVFLEEIPVDNYSMKEIGLLRNRVFEIMENKLREYNAGWIE